MPISSLSDVTENKKSITPIVTYLLGIVSVGLLVFFGGELIKNADSLRSRAALTADSLYFPAKVFINGKEMGNTLFETKNLKPGENKIQLKNDNGQYETTLNFLPSTNKDIFNVGIFRDLGISEVFSSGQEFWFEKEEGNSIRIVSNPSGATVLIDGSEVGKTPYASNVLSEDSYDIEVSHLGFEKQTARVNIKKGYTLNVNIKLFPSPTPTAVGLFEGATDLYNLIAENDLITLDTRTWVKAVIYWNKTRGINIAGAGVNKDLVFDYFLDYQGNVFGPNGEAVEIKDLKSTTKGAYLGRKADGTGLSKEARDSYYLITKGQTGISLNGKSAKIKETGLGWLRVRNLPSASGLEIARVNVGNSYPILESQTGWVKIKVSDTITGWVSAEYVLVN